MSADKKVASDVPPQYLLSGKSLYIINNNNKNNNNNNTSNKNESDNE